MDVFLRGWATFVSSSGVAVLVEALRFRVEVGMMALVVENDKIGEEKDGMWEASHSTIVKKIPLLVGTNSCWLFKLSVDFPST